MTSMQRKWLFGSLWLGFSLYAFLLAPPNDPKTLDQIVALSTVMGVWPMAYVAMLLQDGHCQTSAQASDLAASQISSATSPASSANSLASSTNSPSDNPSKPAKAWPFVLGSFGLGAFALLPYLALRRPAPHWQGEPSKLIRALNSRGFGIFLLANALGWLLFGLTQGDWSNFGEQWNNSRFIHVMSLDFCALTLLFPSLAWDDAQRHGWSRPYWVWTTAIFPIVGATLYLCTRPPLQSPSSTTAALQNSPVEE